MSGPAIQIDEDVPVPSRKRREQASTLAMVLAGLEVGQSFIYPNEEGRKIVNAQMYLSRVWQRMPEKRFTTRTIRRDGGAVLRVWRVE